MRRIRNYWRRWGLHKERANAQMWQEIAEENRRSLRDLERRCGGESYVPTPPS